MFYISMIFLYKFDGNSGERESERDIVFKQLQELVGSFSNWTLVGRYKEGELDDKGRMVEDCYLEIFYVERKKKGVEERYERMYRIRKESIRQRKEIEKWMKEGKVKIGHVNIIKYGHKKDKPIIDI